MHLETNMQNQWKAEATPAPSFIAVRDCNGNWINFNVGGHIDGECERINESVKQLEQK